MIQPVPFLSEWVGKNGPMALHKIGGFLFVHAVVLAAVVSLGGAEPFSIIGRSGVTATGTMRVTGNVGAPASGVTPRVGKIADASEALKDAAKARNELAAMATSTPSAILTDRTFDGDAVF